MTCTTLIAAVRLADLLQRPGTVVVDVRHDLADPDAGERAYRKAHIPGAAFLHQDRDLAGAKTGGNGRHPLPAVDALAERLAGIGVDATSQVVAYDQGSGMFAARLWWLLRWLGHDAVAVLDGGLDGWRAEGRPVTADPPPQRRGSFVPRWAPGMTVSTADVMFAIGTPSLLVVDARSPERYRGEVEPLDPIAGRIPGAVNRPASTNLAGGRFKDSVTLRAEFDALLADRAPASVVHQCGSGITACHNLLAMELAGLSGSRLYPGSWSEWCSDPARPVARGPDQASITGGDKGHSRKQR